MSLAVMKHYPSQAHAVDVAHTKISRVLNTTMAQLETVAKMPITLPGN